MNQSERSEKSPADRSNLDNEIKEWTRGIRCVFVVLNLLPLYYCTRALLAAPTFEMIFEDMLGSKQKLPVLSRLVIENWLPLLGVIWLLTALAVVLI